jgi:hypothetical protein
MLPAACRYIALLVLIPLAGCSSGRGIEQSMAAAGAAAKYHSVNGAWPESRRELLASSVERMPLALRKKDQVWLRQHADGSATVTTIISSWYGGDGMAIRVVPPIRPSTMPQDDATPVLDDYTFDSAAPPKSLGTRLK